MVRQPRLAALPFAADRIAHNVSLVGVPLYLHCLLIQILAAITAAGVSICECSLEPHIELRPPRDTRQIQARAHAGMPRRIDRTHIVVHHRIGIQRHPMIEPGQPPAEIKRPKPGAGIATRSLLSQTDVLEAEKALQERMQRDRHMPFPPPCLLYTSDAAD